MSLCMENKLGEQIVSAFSRMKPENKGMQETDGIAYFDEGITNDPGEIFEQEIDASVNECLDQITLLENIEVGKFVLVAESYGRPKSDHSIGQIVAEDDNDIDISFLHLIFLAKNDFISA